ncbi:MAG: hypothetical protein SNJ77_12135, partial [Cytophagales bacterium]
MKRINIFPKRTWLTLLGFLKLIRFQNLLILGMTQYFTAIFLVVPELSFFQIISDLKFFLLVFSTSLVAG